MRCPACGDEHAPGACAPAPLPPGSRLDDTYVVVDHLSSGGMGVVYEVAHVGLGKRFAAKLLRPEVARRRDVLERFRREARAASAVGSEHIVDVTDLRETASGEPFLVMELLRGRTLGEVIAEEGRVAPARAVHVARQVLEALAAAHERGILHRDLKPDNLFLVERLTASGRDRDFVKVLDFGICKLRGAGHDVDEAGDLTATGAVVGTPTYMAPEQARGDDDIDARADVYAVGAVLYRMLTGARPYSAPNFHALLFAIAQGRLVPPRERTPEVSPALEAVVLRAMAVDREARFPSASAMRDALADDEATREWRVPPSPRGAQPDVARAPSEATPAWSQQSATMIGGAGAAAPTVWRERRMARVAAASVAALVVGMLALAAYDLGRRVGAPPSAAAPVEERGSGRAAASEPIPTPPPAPGGSTGAPSHGLAGGSGALASPASRAGASAALPPPPSSTAGRSGGAARAGASGAAASRTEDGSPSSALHAGPDPAHPLATTAVPRARPRSTAARTHQGPRRLPGPGEPLDAPGDDDLAAARKLLESLGDL